MRRPRLGPFPEQQGGALRKIHRIRMASAKVLAWPRSTKQTGHMVVTEIISSMLYGEQQCVKGRGLKSRVRAGFTVVTAERMLGGKSRVMARSEAR